MTLASLLTRPVTIEHRSPSASLDKYGNPLAGTTSSTETVGYLEQTEAVEVVVGQETYTSTDLLVLPAGTSLDGSDRVVVDGERFEVLGAPNRPWGPSTGEHHVEARMKRSVG